MKGGLVSNIAKHILAYTGDHCEGIDTTWCELASLNKYSLVVLVNKGLTMGLFQAKKIKLLQKYNLRAWKGDEIVYTKIIGTKKRKEKRAKSQEGMKRKTFEFVSKHAIYRLC